MIELAEWHIDRHNANPAISENMLFCDEFYFYVIRLLNVNK